MIRTQCPFKTLILYHAKELYCLSDSFVPEECNTNNRAFDAIRVRHSKAYTSIRINIIPITYISLSLSMRLELILFFKRWVHQHRASILESRLSLGGIEPVNFESKSQDPIRLITI